MTAASREDEGAGVLENDIAAASVTVADLEAVGDGDEVFGADLVLDGVRVAVRVLLGEDVPVGVALFVDVAVTAPVREVVPLSDDVTEGVLEPVGDVDADLVGVTLGELVGVTEIVVEAVIEGELLAVSEAVILAVPEPERVGVLVGLLEGVSVADIEGEFEGVSVGVFVGV